MKKKLFILFFALAASVGSMSAAVVNGTCGDNLTWTLDTQTKTLTIEGSGKMTSHPWANYKQYVVNVSLPDGLTNIGKEAFSGCSSMTSIELPNSVTSIGESAFLDCFDLLSIEIPESVISIGNYAFRMCTDLTSVNIPSNVTSIGKQVFMDCALTSIEIPESVTSIGSEAFYGCKKLTSVTCWAITPPSGGTTCSINPSNCTLYVPVTALDTYANTLWWEDFNQILPVSAQNLLVRFVDWDGTTLSYTEVESGTAATAPANPSREGYTFIGWDQDFSNVTEDMTITALYQINQYQIAVTSNDESFGSIEGENGTFDYLSEHTYTAIPSEGHYFVRWSDNETANPRTIVLTQDVAVTAVFATYQYTITWQDEEGNVIKTDEVPYGETPIYSGEVPTKDAVGEVNYQFAGWLPTIKPATRDYFYTTHFKEVVPEKVYTVNINGENCSLHISNEVPAGTTLQVEAVADECFEFEKWSDNETANPRTITVTEDANLTAEFNKLQYTITGKNENTGGHVQVQSNEN